MIVEDGGSKTAIAVATKVNGDDGDGNNAIEEWKPVRSKKSNKQQQQLQQTRCKGETEVDKASPRQPVISSTIDDDLTFMLDEELSDAQFSLAGRKKAYTNYDDFTALVNEEDEFHFEISDKDLAKVMIVTQTPRKGGMIIEAQPPQHVPQTHQYQHQQQQFYDRTGDWKTRVKVTQEIAKVINEGLYHYETDLRKARFDRGGSTAKKQHRTLGLITQKEFDLYSCSPKTTTTFNTPPPPPPPPCLDRSIDDPAQGFISHSLSLFAYASFQLNKNPDKVNPG